MGLFKKQTAEQDVARVAFATAAELEILGNLPCAAGACSRHDATACNYADHRGRTCGTPACPDHRQIVDGRPFCVLHAETVRATGLNGNGHHLPEVNNRAPSRVSWVARDLHDEIVEILQGHLRPEDQDRLLIDDAVHPMRSTEGSRRWEQAWKIVNHTGMPLKVSVAIDEARPNEIVVRVGSEVVSRATPQWFSERRHGAEAPGDAGDGQRRAFYQPIYRRIAEAVGTTRSAGVRGPY